MTASGGEPYAEYVDALRNREGAARIKARGHSEGAWILGGL